jgi:hypothetical protein
MSIHKKDRFWGHAPNFLKFDKDEVKDRLIMNLRKFGACPLVLFVFVCCSAARLIATDKQWTGSRTSPVHRIPLKDELDQPIVPTEPNPLPFSSRFSCAPCHDYGVIESGLHFSEGRGGGGGRAGEPWFRVDEKTGTVLPLSYHGRPGTWNPGALGLSTWDFTLLFGRHTAGGGVAEPRAEEMTPGSRWEVSGRVEINCLGCHNASPLQDHSEWARQILRENFRWAATAAAGLGEVGGMASRLRGTWDVFDGPNPDDSEWAVAPSVRYDRTRFDSKHRVFLDVPLKPGDERCLACHAVSPVGAAKSDADGDVHLAAGLACVSCHRNGIDHDMIRGYEGEMSGGRGKDEPAEDFSCAGCHLGKDAAHGGKGWAGRLGAPYPLHKGLPKVHFERLSCTVCHSGPLPARDATRVRTARANRLGIFGIASWATNLPAVLEPVYIRSERKKLTPHRVVWPAFWAHRNKDGTLVPLAPETVLAAAAPAFEPPEKASRVLSFLAGALGEGERAVLLLDGNAFELNADAVLTPSDAAAGRGAKGLFWTAGADGTLAALVPEIDPAAAEPQPDAEAKVQKILEALAADTNLPGPPALAVKDVVYRITDGYLDKVPSAEPAPAAAEPVLGCLVDGKVRPLLSDFDVRTLAAVAGKDSALTEEQVVLALAELNKAAADKAPGAGVGAVYISGGKLHELDAKGRLRPRDDAAAGFVAWPLAHDVRPARQSLGVHGCTDCHSLDSKFFFGTVMAEGPLVGKRTIGRPASSFMGLGGLFHRMFGLSFTARPLLKIVLAAVVLVLGLVTLLAASLALGRLTGLLDKRR